MINARTAEQIAKVVQERLNHAGNGSPMSVRVLANKVRPGGDDGMWWYVPVSYQQDPFNAYRYYDAFARIEEELEKEAINVLLVPSIIPTPPELQN